MSSSEPFTFSFSTRDISISPPATPPPAAQSSPPPAATAFPLQSGPLLPATPHTLASLLSTLPSSLAYSTLRIVLDSGTTVSLPRRELWDVRLQLMAEQGADDDGENAGLGKEDVKTGIYEGGFKSWESSADLVRVLEARMDGVGRVVELGCGTAIPTTALLQAHLNSWTTASAPIALTFADYNPSVLSLVTLPNILLTWAEHRHRRQSPPPSSPWETDGELAITAPLLDSFEHDLVAYNISLSFVSGTWSPEFETLVTPPALAPQQDNKAANGDAGRLLVLAAETIYSPFALRLCAETVVGVLKGERGAGSKGNSGALALVAAKKVYFGVGGSLEEFCEMLVGEGCVVETIREETVGVRRAIVEVGLGQGAAGDA